ncbi:MAG: ABC transporter ATP-binding protein, partial [Candidatus Binatia bacterium]
MLVCLLLAAIAEGVGLSTLLPLLSLATTTTEHSGSIVTSEHSHLGQIVTYTLSLVGLPQTMGALLVLIVASMFLKSGLVLLAQRQIGYTVAHVATDLRLALIRSVLAAQWEYYIRQPVGSFANAFATEANRAAQAYLHGATIVELFLETLLYLGIAASVSWQVTLSATAVGAFIAVTLGRFVRITRRAGKRQTSLLKVLLARLTDVLYAVKPLKAMAREGLIGTLLEKETQQLNRTLRRDVLSKEALKALQEPLTIAALAGGLYVALHYWTLPLDTVILMALLFARALSRLNKVQKEYQQMVACESAFWSLQKTIEQSTTAREVIHGTTTPQLTQAITLRNVSLSYGSRPVLRDVSLTIPVGTVTAIVGPSGAGKTSIADLIVGLVPPQGGELLIDNTAIQDLDLRAWRRMIGYMPQESFLLHESVLVNVSLGDRTLTPTDVESALRAAEAWDFVSVLPEGLQTPVGERGARFSGGQRQRIAIARTLVHKPQIQIRYE